VRARACAVAIAAAAAVVLMAPPVRADDASPIAEAQRLMDEVRFDKARETLDGALRQGTSDPAGVAAIYRMLGEVAVAMGEPAAAEDAFRHLLVVDPSAQLPAGTSPKIQSAFDAARSTLAGQPPLQVRAEPTASGGVVLIVEADPLDLVRGGRASYVRADGAPRRIEGSGHGRVELVVPEEAPIALEVAALDANGNALRVVAVRRRPVARPTTTIVVEKRPPPAPRAWYGRWYPWAGAAVLAGGAAGFFAVQAQRDQDALDALIADSGGHSYAEAAALERRGQRNALIANVGAGVAAGLVVIAGVLLVTDSSDSSSGPEPAARARAVVIAPDAGPDHLGVVAWTRF